MQILLSCAKTMSQHSKVAVPFVTTPHFFREASEIALQMSQLDVTELEHLLRVNAKIAVENYKRYQNFHAGETPALPALLAYTGIVFKRLHPQNFTPQQFAYAQEHLLLTSFCYGLLRPLDAIRCYRLEGDATLPELGGSNIFAYWHPRLTEHLLAAVHRTGGVLCNLASEEMKQLFDWHRVECEAHVITPEFLVWKEGRWRSVVVYIKMARGEMARFLLQNETADPEVLKSFTWEGFAYNDHLSDKHRFVFTHGGEE